MPQKDDLCRFLGMDKYNSFTSSYFNPMAFINSLQPGNMLSRKDKFDILIKEAYRPGMLKNEITEILRNHIEFQKGRGNGIGDITLEELLSISGTESEQMFYNIESMIKDKLNQKNYEILPTNFTRCRVPTKETDVFISNTELYHRLNVTSVIKIWDKRGQTAEEQMQTDKKYKDELRNNNYYRRVGLNLTERQVAGKERDFNFLMMTYLSGSDALDISQKLEDKVSQIINTSEKKKAISQKDAFRKNLCDHIAKVHAFSSPLYAKQEGEDFQTRIENNIISAYNRFFQENRNLLDEEERNALDSRLSLISKDIGKGANHLISGLESLPNGIYTDRFLRNIMIEGRNIIGSVDYGSIKKLPAQFDLAFAFIQSHKIPDSEKKGHLSTYFKGYQRYIEEYNMLVENKTKDLEKTILEELDRPDLCSPEIRDSAGRLAIMLRDKKILTNISKEDIDKKKDDVYDFIKHFEDADKLKDYVDEVFSYVSSLEKKEQSSQTFLEFSKGMALSETYRALIVGSAYLNYMKGGIDEDNLDYFIQLINSSQRAWREYASRYMGDINKKEKENIDKFRNALIGYKNLALKLKKGSIERYGSKKADYLVDFHIHTGSTEDARRKDDDVKNNLINILSAAYKQGLKHVSITNHIYLFGQKGNDTSDIEYLEKESDMIDKVKDGLKINVSKGIEVDYLGKKNEEAVRDEVETIDKRCNGLDYIIGSVHRIDGEWFLPTKDSKKVWSDKEPAAYYRDYFNLVLDAVNSSIFNYIAHPDVIRKFENDIIKPVPFEAYKDIAQRIVESAVEKDVGFEINVKGLIHPVGVIYPSKEFLSMYINACYKQNKRPRLILGTDSHSIQELEKSIESKSLLKGYLHALECGYDGTFRPIS